MLLNILLPWRWKRKVDEVLNAKFELNRMSMLAGFDELRGALQAEIELSRASFLSALDDLRRHLEAEISDLGDAVLETAARQEPLASLKEMHAVVNGARARLEDQLAEIGREICEIRKAGPGLNVAIGHGNRHLRH